MSRETNEIIGMNLRRGDQRRNEVEQAEEERESLPVDAKRS